MGRQEPVPHSPLPPSLRRAEGQQSRTQYESPVGLRKAHVGCGTEGQFARATAGRALRAAEVAAQVLLLNGLLVKLAAASRVAVVRGVRLGLQIRGG